MSEEKAIKHTHKAVKILEDKSIPLKEKIKGFIEEIIIIVFAVSITLMFHNWNDSRHERELERNFLIGTQADLRRNAANLTASIKYFQPTIDYYNNVWKLIKSKKIDSLYVDTASGYLINTAYFVFDDSRFEGFKSSGYLRLIENEPLLKHLVTLYSISMPFERDADINVFHTREQDYSKYIGIKADIDTSGNIHVSKLLNDPAVRYQIFRYMAVFDERKKHKQLIVNKMLALADEIEKDLNK